MNNFLWLILFLVAVYDAREYRIPNYLLCSLLIFHLLEYYTIPSSAVIFSSKFFAMGIVFSLALTFYISGWMAAGDVKLLSLIGFVVGLDGLANTFFWISCSSLCISLMYLSVSQRLILYYAYDGSAFRFLFSSLFGFRTKNKCLSVMNGKDSFLVMPFAPAVVIGLALDQYVRFL